MSDTTSAVDRIEKPGDLGEGDAGLWRFWDAQERVAEKDEKPWVRRSRRIIKRYRDEREESARYLHRMSILWSNVQTLKPTLYARTPKPDVQRRFLDQDPTGRLASMLLERCISYSLEAHEFDRVMEAAVEDRLLPGRGVARVKYVPHFGDPLDPDEATEGEDDAGEAAEPLRHVVYEEAVASYVFWEDYREGPARTWAEVPWVRYRSYMTLEELTERFGAAKAKQVTLDYVPSGAETKGKPPPDLLQKAIIHETWDRENKRVLWWAPGTPDLILDKQDDPLQLQDFFPNPDPLLATTTTDKRIPVPDYVEYQDQARELDNITARIDVLVSALRVAGIYAASEKQMLSQLFDGSMENKMIPVEGWMAFMDKGGLKGMVDYVPIQQVAQTLIQLYDARDRVKQLMYEVTGIGDIMRGQTQPNETATAQALKTNFVTRRVVPQQRAVARFARDMIRLLGGVIAEHFSAETISEITGYPQLLPVPQLPPPPPQMIPAPMPAPQTQPQPPPAQPPPAQPPANDGMPPEARAALQEGHVTTFGNGQRWTMRGGLPARVA